MDDQPSNDGYEQYRAMRELEQETEEALLHAKQLGLPEQELRLLCYQAGIQYERLAR